MLIHVQSLCGNGVTMVMGLFDLQTIVSDAVGHDQVKVFQKLFTR